MADYGFTEESVAAYQEKSKSWTGKRITRKEALETATAIMKAAEDERKPKKPSKYRNEKTEVDGIIFGSAKKGDEQPPKYRPTEVSRFDSLPPDRQAHFIAEATRQKPEWEGLPGPIRAIAEKLAMKAGAG